MLQETISQRKNFLFFVFISTSIFFAYFGLYDNYFYRDDTSAFYAGYILSKSINNIFAVDFNTINMTEFKRYIVILSYLPNYMIGGIDPKHYYTFNILIHIVNSCLVFLIAKKISDKKLLPYLCAIFFAISQDRSDAIMMIAHRTTLFGAFSVLFLCWLYLFMYSRKNSILHFAIYILIYSVIIFTYETSIMLPFAIIMLTCLFDREMKMNKFALGVNIYALCLSVFLIFVFNLSPRMDLAHQVRNLFAAIPTMFIPVNFLQEGHTQSLDPLNLHSLGLNYGGIEFVGIFLFIFIITSGIALRNRIVLFGLAFYLIFAFPSSSHPWAYYPEFSDSTNTGIIRWSIGKFTYLASFGSSLILSVFIVLVFDNVNKNKTRLKAAILSIVVFLYISYSIYCIDIREYDWHRITNRNRHEVDLIHKNKESIRDMEFVAGPSLLTNTHLEKILIVITDKTSIKVLSPERFNEIKNDKSFNMMKYGIFKPSYPNYKKLNFLKYVGSRLVY